MILSDIARSRIDIISGSFDPMKSMMKRKMHVKVRKKLRQRKKTEETLKINMHNLMQHSYLSHTNLKMIKNYR